MTRPAPTPASPPSAREHAHPDRAVITVTRQTPHAEPSRWLGRSAGRCTANQSSCRGRQRSADTATRISMRGRAPERPLRPHLPATACHDTVGDWLAAAAGAQGACGGCRGARVPSLPFSASARTRPTGGETTKLRDHFTKRTESDVDWAGTDAAPARWPRHPVRLGRDGARRAVAAATHYHQT